MTCALSCVAVVLEKGGKWLMPVLFEQPVEKDQCCHWLFSSLLWTHLLHKTVEVNR